MQFFLLLNEALNSLNRHLHRRGLSKDLLLFSRLNQHNISNGGARAVEAMESYHHLHKIHQGYKELKLARYHYLCLIFFA
jgi:hypothetical protein